jgi:sugar lactone lactonase YvrE
MTYIILLCSREAGSSLTTQRHHVAACGDRGSVAGWLAGCVSVVRTACSPCSARGQVPLPGGQGADALALSPDEKWLAASSAYANLVSVHPVDPTTGAAGQAVATVACNQTYGVAFTGDGAHIVVTSRADDVVRVYTFDASTGALGTTATREFAAHHNPASIVTADVNKDGIVRTRAVVTAHVHGMGRSVARATPCTSSL